jgi:hypothetical protein
MEGVLPLESRLPERRGEPGNEDEADGAGL